MLNVGLLVALLGASVMLFYGGPDSYAIRSLKELWNLGHVVYFGFLVYLLWRMSSFKLSRNQIWLLSLILTLIWGGSIEVLQYGSEREADLMDLSRDFCGTLLALGFIPGLMLPVRKFVKVVIRCVVFVFTLFHLSPLVIALSDEAIARVQFPVLSSFETPFELDRWTGNVKHEVVTGVGGKQGPLLKIDLDSQRYPGVKMRFLPSDWRGHRALNFDIFYAGINPLRLTIKVYDARHQSVHPTYLYDDRYNHPYQLQAGWNYIQIPLIEIEKAPQNRDMDMSQIANVSLFSNRLKQPSTIYLDKVYLEN